MKDIVVTLYHAKWCAYCVKFKPQWKTFTEICKKYKYDIEKNYDISLSCREFEDSQNPLEIKEAQVEGFPTINIAIDNAVTQYDGERSTKGLLMHLFDYDNKEQSVRDKITEDINKWENEVNGEDKENEENEGNEDNEPKIHDAVVGMLTKLGLDNQSGGYKSSKKQLATVESIAYYKYLKYKNKYAELKRMNK